MKSGERASLELVHSGAEPSLPALLLAPRGRWRERGRAPPGTGAAVVVATESRCCFFSPRPEHPRVDVTGSHPAYGGGWGRTDRALAFP